MWRTTQRNAAAEHWSDAGGPFGKALTGAPSQVSWPCDTGPNVASGRFACALAWGQPTLGVAVSKLTFLAVLLVAVVCAGPVAAGPSGLIVADPSVVAYRGDGSSLTVSVQVSNPTRDMAVVSLAVGTCGAVGTPVVEPRSTSDVSFELTECPTAVGTVNAEVTAALTSPAGRQTQASAVPLSLTVEDFPGTDWGALWMFLVGFAALLAVIPPYLTWLAFPLGNETARARFRKEDGIAIIKKLWSKDFWDHLDHELPGISSDWNFKDNWASNVGLAGALFTGVFAAAGPLSAFVGDEATPTLAVVAVASALSAALIASGPLWLTILKRRTWANEGYARHHTVAGILMASFVVYFATIGLIATTMRVASGLVPGALLGFLAVGALLLLIAYAWKSIPLTLGLGASKPAGEMVWVVEQGPSPDQWLMVRRKELSSPTRTDEAATEPMVLREVDGPRSVSAMP